MDMPWLSDAKARFMQQLHSAQMPHALLLGLSQGYGGMKLAEDIAAAALCSEPTARGDCGHCKSCQLVLAGNHPDFHLLEADGKQIKVDQVRALCQDLTSTAQQGGRRVALIAQSERLNQAAANALLKTLEEPGQGTLIILQTDSTAGLLPTISSRCQRVQVKLPDNSAIQSWLAQQLPLPADVTWCLPVVGGPLKLAEVLQSDRYQTLLDYRRDWRASLLTGHLCASLLTVGEEQISDVLRVLYLVLHRELLTTEGEDPLLRARIATLAAKVMDTCNRLSQMPSVNYLALCQNYVLEYKRLKT